MRWLYKIIISATAIFSLIEPTVGLTASNTIFLPILFSGSTLTNQPTINVPYFDVNDVISQKGAEMGVFWFGKVTPNENYTDVRVGYHNTELDFHVAIFDRLLWYDTNPKTADFTQWDAVAITLQPDNANPLKPTSSSYKFLASLHWWEADNLFIKSYKGNGTGWVEQPVVFSTKGGWRGDSPNNNNDDRGWTMDFHIPFSSLGLPAKPAEGSFWRLGVTVYDRDGQNFSPESPKMWPEGSNNNNPSTWGKLRFGVPVFNAPVVSNSQTTTIRQGLNGATVSDGAVGGGTVCGDGYDFFSQLGNANYYNFTYMNIQNQVDVADWPCYSKYYVTFPMAQIPPGKGIKSARLSLHQFGGSDPTQAYSSLIQVMTVANDWDEKTLAWNNAPLAQENISQTWVNVLTGPLVWPGTEYQWDVSRAVTQAYQSGNPVRLVLYSADFAYHSGKYFTTSETGEWDAVGRPTLFVEWGDLSK